LNLRAVLDLNDIVGNQSMGLAMHGRRGIRVRSVDKAKDLASAFIVPVLQVLHPVLVLCCHVTLVSTGDSGAGQALDLVAVYVEWRGWFSFSLPRCLRLGDKPDTNQTKLAALLATSPLSTLVRQIDNRN
jgi:hypothetical protein